MDGRAARTLAADHPTFEIGAVAYTNKEVWIGGMQGVPLSRITGWLCRVRAALASCLAGAGVAVPGDFSGSRIEGDDDLTWPTERLRFHWSIGRLDEQHWPHEKMPEDVSEILSRILAGRRARDHRD